MRRMFVGSLAVLLAFMVLPGTSPAAADETRPPGQYVSIRATDPVVAVGADGRVVVTVEYVGPERPRIVVALPDGLPVGGFGDAGSQGCTSTDVSAGNRTLGIEGSPHHAVCRAEFRVRGEVPAMWLLGDVTALPASGVLEVSEGSIQVVEPTPPAFLGWEPPLPPLSVGEDVSADLVAAQVGFPAAVYEVSGGRLPEGLVLDPVSGSLTGVPTTAGDFAFTVRAVNVGGSDERSVSGTVAKGATALTAMASPSRAPYGAQVTLAAAGLPPVATGSVDFLVDGESVCVVTLPALECDVTGLMPGDHLVEAVYSGDVNWEGSRVEAGTVTVDRRPATLQGAAAAETIEHGETAEFVAQLEPADATGTISVTSRGVELCAIALPATSCRAEGLDAGSHPLSFVYSGDDLTEAAAVEGGTLEVTSPPVIDPPGPSPQPSPEPEPEPAPTGDSPQPQPTRQDVAAASSRNASPAALPHAGGPAMAFVVFGLIAAGAGAALIRARRRPREDSNLRHTL